MKLNKNITKPILYAIGTGICVLCLLMLGIYINRPQGDLMPKQDTDGYYLLCTKEDFKWFITTVNNGDTEINARLNNDIILNDISNWENWADVSPAHQYSVIYRYNGHFDGNGFAMEGYYSNHAETWQTPVFMTLEENSKITNLHIRNSFFRTSYKDSSYENDIGRTNVATASVLCYSNYGFIEGCDIYAKVMGAWSAGGIASVNYGTMVDCHFGGSVSAGLAKDTEMPENGLDAHTLYAGGICRTNEGFIHNCQNDGAIALGVLPENYYMTYAAGGIAGRSTSNSVIEDSENTGFVECAQLAGGITGASWGSIVRCVNSGDIHIEQTEWKHTESLIAAGICASNSGTIDTCFHKGSVTITQSISSFYAPIYGIACNIVNPNKGTITNCYYLKENTKQAYRQSGVHKLSADEMDNRSAYRSGDKKVEDIDTWELLDILPDYSGTDADDYIHLGFGPSEDVHYEVKQGDSLWSLAEEYYGNGSYYNLLEREEAADADSPLAIGEQIVIPHKDYYLLRTNDEEGNGWSYCVLPSGEPCPMHFIAAKPIDWYYGYMHSDASKGLDVMWPKDKEKGHDEPAAAIRILYRLDGNPNGNFFADWEAAKQSIRRSADTCCGDAVDGLRFYRYTLDNGENLYGYSFRLYRKADTLECAAFYRIRDGFLAEYVGIEPVGEDEHVLERVRYLAAEIDNVLTVLEIQSDCASFYGKETWDFPLLHNPFAISLEYSETTECSSYMLFTGAQ